MADASPSKDAMMVELSATSAGLHVMCKGTLRDVRHTMQRVEKYMRAQRACPELTADLNLVLSEAMTNIARHAYPDKEGPIILHMHLVEGGVACRLMDCGIAYDPYDLGLALPDPATDPEGGFGWFLIKCLTHQLSYGHENGRNVLKFTMKSST